MLFYDSFKPEVQSAWSKAQRIHHISPKSVTNKQIFTERLEEVQSIIDKTNLVVAYNAAFDFRFLEAQGINLSGKQYVCAMESFSNSFMRSFRFGKSAKWKSLESCAAFFDIPAAGAHDALTDARLTLVCFKAMLIDKRFSVHPKKWKNSTSFSCFGAGNNHSANCS